MPSLIVHGGAWAIPEAERNAHREGCRAAVEQGWAVLIAGGSALDAVVAAIVVMEDDPTFDAGRGSFLNADGEVELDASLMRGDDLAAGSVAAVSGIANPISLARIVLNSEYVTIVGTGAARFAVEQGMERCGRDRLVAPREQARWEAARAGEPVLSYKAMLGGSTVGAVAQDSNGLVAAGTSTGGSPLKPAGRVGDSPLIGCGTYADNRGGGVSCTGWGEGITRVTMARVAVLAMRQGKDAKTAAALALDELAMLGGVGGLVAIDSAGRLGWIYNTPRMAYAYRFGEMESSVAEV